MEELWNLVVNNFVGFLLVLCRVTGIFTFNPIFSRTNVPANIKAMISIALAVLMYSFLGGKVSYSFSGVPEFVWLILTELFIGWVFGTLVYLIITVFIYAGEIIDNQIGLGMAKAMDPTTGIQMPVFANVYYYLFVLYFFITGGHLSYIELFAVSYDSVPIGFDMTLATLDLMSGVVMYLGTAITLAVKFAAPIIAAELITEVSIGIMMKAVPTIQVMTINFQLKIIIGLFVLLALATPMSDLINTYMGYMWENLYGALNIIGT